MAAVSVRNGWVPTSGKLRSSRAERRQQHAKVALRRDCAFLPDRACRDSCPDQLTTSLFLLPIDSPGPRTWPLRPVHLVNFTVPEPSSLSAWLACSTRSCSCCPRAIHSPLPATITAPASPRPHFAYAKGQPQHTAPATIAADTTRISLTDLSPRSTSRTRHNYRSKAAWETAFCDLLAAQTVRLRLHQGRSTTTKNPTHYRKGSRTRV